MQLPQSTALAWTVLLRSDTAVNGSRPEAVLATAQTGWHVSPEMTGPGRAVAPGGRVPAVGKGAQPHVALPKQTELGLRNRCSRQDKKPSENLSVGWVPQKSGETGAGKAAPEGEGAVALQSPTLQSESPLVNPHALGLMHLSAG